MESRKQAVSIRMSASDVRKIKRIAQRLGVRDSDVIRFAVKSMLHKLGPLHDPMIRGRNLVPVFLDWGDELFHHFELDAVRLEGIVNEGVEADARVSHDDIQLIAMSGARQPYLRWTAEQHPGTATKAGMNGSASRAEGNGDAERQRPSAMMRAEAEHDRAATSVRSYLFKKFLYGDSGTR